MKFITLALFFDHFWLLNSIIHSELFPPNSGVPNADIYLRFAYPIKLPAKTLITIQQTFAPWQSSNGDINDYCWCNFDYISCRFVGHIEIQTSVDIRENQIIEIYLDKPIGLGSVSQGNYQGFSVEASWLGVVIAYDSSSDNTVTIKPLVTFYVWNWQITFETMTPAAISNYKFKFTSDSDVNPGYHIIIYFDRKFNPWMGEPKSLNIVDKNEKNDYYIGCSSDTLGDISCIAKHWYVIVKDITKSVLANNVIDVKLESLWTPSFGQVSMRFYILDSNYDLKSYIDAVSFTINNDLPANIIDFKSMKISDNRLLNTAKYEFEFYVGNLNLQDYIIFVQFPQEYNLAKNPSFSCNVTYFDESSQTPDKEMVWFYWNGGDYCTYYNRYAMMSIPYDNPKQFTSSMRIKVAINGILNPQRACKNEVFVSWENIDVAGDDYLSGKFDIEIYDPSIARSIAKSWGLAHNVYTGLNKTNKSFQFVSKGSSHIF